MRWVRVLKLKVETFEVETPQKYLELTVKFLEQVKRMVSKFDHEQCQYLVDKLGKAIQSAESFLKVINTWYSTFASDEDIKETLEPFQEIFKMLLSLGKEVESFIQGCNNVAWVHSAIELKNVSEHISSLGFNLHLFTIVLSTRKNLQHYQV